MRAVLKSQIALAALVLSAGQAYAQATLNIFTNPSVAYSVSADGNWVTLGNGAPTGGSDVYLWSTVTDTLTDIGGYAGNSGVTKISADGSIVAAQTKDASGNLVSSVYNANKGTWTAAATLGGTSASVATSTWALSADGRYIGGLGYVAGSSTPHGFVTDTVTGTVADLGATQARIQGISAGAQTLIGYTGSGQAGSMWTLNADGSYTQTTIMDPGTPTSSLSNLGAMSSNGLWAGGSSFNGITANPYRVNLQTGQVQFFNKVPVTSGTGKVTASVASVSADGNTMVGIESPQGAGLPQSFGFIWKADGTVNGNTLGGTAMSFDDYLTSYGIDLANQYTFLSVIGMNADATVFSGIALDNNTLDQVAFVVTIPSTAAVPEPSEYALLTAGLLSIGWLARRRRQG